MCESVRTDCRSWVTELVIAAWCSCSSTVAFVYVYRSPDEAAGSVEWMDVEDGHYLGAFSDRGEVIMMGQGDVSCVTRAVAG